MINTAATAARNESELMNAEKMPVVCPAAAVAAALTGAACHDRCCSRPVREGR